MLIELRNVRYHFQVQDASDRNGGVGMTAQCSDPADPGAFSPTPSLSKESETLSESRGTG